MNALSQPEINFIKEGIKTNIRTDGRANIQFREIKCEKGVIDQANGSVRLCLGKTEVVVGVKCELGEPSVLTPESGRYNVLVKQVGTMTSRDVEIEKMILVSLENAGKDMLQELCVLKGKLCWIIYVDVVVVEDDGNVMDCTGLAVRAALLNTLIPIVNVISGDSDTVQVDIDKDNVQFKKFKPESVPLCVSLIQFEKEFIADPSKVEEKCNGSEITTAITSNGKVCGIQKGGNGCFKTEEMYDMIIQAQMIGLKLFKELDELLEE
ncbi:3' exoribonuclease family protein [Entamoeba histolytica HM-1:IMSS-B]|uniref:Ribosomal RNA-processing protein 42 n=8 Tax=Entamoeba TaxID=5758 RepID=C4M182_ENTH1|nr:3' exoribonuclease family protein [Entamoeba nuttalli P19]XP_653674.1 3' exoribonuclease family protein [Entamoeba histolytica HM-1:IMSS]EMD49236.1 3' exoribonuclease family protein [Entamoeba histolytica KU27]EMH74481.1 3' exoribonuclease family protein [Entamoeba histolytica HM-1:IMSS-B]EMS15604.1 3' exoribonuclease family protein [Entamoeba histolytica HM-3:IMSS]ENY63516.1 3' exoribonuclease family protein, putative [Entamoeba histolytica HM-1:IMSS-A]GAT94957.1 3 exoribonuclease family |eukprot:XP_008860193.1 3' exoribonuclease family protein [Entamoeba nuttalli P19]